MSEECSNGVNVNTLVLQLHSKSVPEAMEGDVLADSSLADPSGDMYCKDSFSNKGEYFTL